MEHRENAYQVQGDEESGLIGMHKEMAVAPEFLIRLWNNRGNLEPRGN